MRVSDLMHTPAVTCRPDATIREVAQLMERRHVGSVIMVDEVGEVAGIVTDRDIVLRGVARGHSGDIAIEEVATRNVATVEGRADVADAAAIMLKRRVRRLPVVDEQGNPHGLLALDDLIRNLGREADEMSDLLLSQGTNLAREG